MGDWILTGGIGRAASYGRVAGGSGWMTAVTGHASANTKGSYVEFCSSLPFDADLIIINHSYAESTYDFLIDIAVGAAGSEYVIISNLIRSSAAQSSFPSGPFYAPIRVPSGSRISARCQSSTGGKGARLWIQALATDFFRNSLSVIDTYGAATADSGGTSVDPGGSAGTKGAYSQITASTVRPHKGIILGVGNQVNTTRTAADFNVDIAVGGAGSEVVLIPDIHCGVIGSGYSMNLFFSVFYPVYIPISTRLSVRSECSITDATDRTFDAILYCFG